MVKVGELIEPKNERNSDLRYGIDLIEGVTSEGIFAPTKATKTMSCRQKALYLQGIVMETYHEVPYRNTEF